MVQVYHEAGIEVILDVVYNHTAEGNHLGPTLSFKGIDNAAYYRLVEDDPRLLHGLHRHRQLAECPAPALPAADHGLPALLGHRDARGRVPLRPRLHARPGVLRRRQALHILRAGAAGPGGLAGQADRRAVGRRTRRVPGRQVPGAVDGVEREIPRHGPRLLARRAGIAGRVRLPLTGSADLYESGRPPSGRFDQLRHRARRLHAGAISSPTTRSTTTPTARTTRTASRTTGPGTVGVEGPTDDDEVLRLRARQQRNFLATLLLSQGVPMLAHGDELGRTPAGQQQHLRARTPSCPGCTGPTPTSRWWSSPRRCRRLRREHPTFRRAPILRRPPGAPRARRAAA